MGDVAGTRKKVAGAVRRTEWEGEWRTLTGREMQVRSAKASQLGHSNWELGCESSIKYKVPPRVCEEFKEMAETESASWGLAPRYAEVRLCF